MCLQLYRITNDRLKWRAGGLRPGSAGDAAPIGVVAVHRRFDQAAARDGPRDRVGGGPVRCPAACDLQALACGAGSGSGSGSRSWASVKVRFH